jgi:hypothetical protein
LPRVKLTCIEAMNGKKNRRHNMRKPTEAIHRKRRRRHARIYIDRERTEKTKDMVGDGGRGQVHQEHFFHP